MDDYKIEFIEEDDDIQEETDASTPYISEEMEANDPFKVWEKQIVKQPIVWSGYEPGDYNVEVLPDGYDNDAEEFEGAWESIKNIGRVYPVADTAANLITSAYGLPISGLVGAASLPSAYLAEKIGLTDKPASETATDIINKAQELLVYTPQTKEGEQLTSGAMYPFEKWGELSKITAEKVYEETDNALLAALTEGVIGALPAAIPLLKGTRGSSLTKRQARMVVNKLKETPNIDKMLPEQLQDHIEGLINIEVGKQFKSFEGVPKETLSVTQELDAYANLLENTKQLKKEMQKQIAKDPSDGDAGMALTKLDDTINTMNNEIMQKVVNIDNGNIKIVSDKLNELIIKITDADVTLDKSGKLGALKDRATGLKLLLEKQSGFEYNSNANLATSINTKKRLISKVNGELKGLLKDVSRATKNPDIGRIIDQLEESRNKVWYTEGPGKVYDETTIEGLNEKYGPEKVAEAAELVARVDSRMKAARGKQQSLFQKVVTKTKDLTKHWGRSITREYEHLPKTAEFAPLRFELLKLNKQKDLVADKALVVLEDITKDVSRAPVDYELFTRKVLLDDLYESRNLYKGDKEIPFGFKNIDEVKSLKDATDIQAKSNKLVKQAIEKRKKHWEDLRHEYIRTMSDIGYDVGDKITRENYYRHIIKDYEEAKRGLYGTGKKLKTPAQRSYMYKRRGSGKDYSTDYVEVEAEVISQMKHDIEVAKTIKLIEDRYDISTQVKEGFRKKLDKNKVVYDEDFIEDNWRANIPDTHVTWQPRDGNVFHLVESMSGELAQELFTNTLEKLGLELTMPDPFTAPKKGQALVWDVKSGKPVFEAPWTDKQIRRIFSKDGRYRELVIDERIAKTLDNLVVDKDSNPIIQGRKTLIKKWKQAALMSPKRLLKYNIRNVTGDADAVFVGNPGSFSKMPKAVSDLVDYYKNKKMSPELKDWYERGGTLSTLQAQEMGALKKLQDFVRKETQKKSPKGDKIPQALVNSWKWYWKKARNLTDMREGILRYSSYMDYLEQMNLNRKGKPGNFGASIPEEIMGLSNVKDRAYWLSNDLLGAYDRVGATGQALRESVFPFWSWKEVNFTRYKRFIQNAAADDAFAGTVGKKIIGNTIKASPKVAYKVGKFAIKASAFWTMLQVWNNMKYPELERQLPEHVRNRPHVVLGKNEKTGDIQYFSRIGALGDFLEWFGLDAAPEYVDDYFNKGKGMDEIAKKMAGQAADNVVNTFVNGSLPFIKLAGETITRRKLFPDYNRPGVVRDRIDHSLSLLPELQDAYRFVVSKRPSPLYSDRLSSVESAIEYGKSFGLYQVDPGNSAYIDTLGIVREFSKKVGKQSDGFWFTPKGQALYNAKLSLRYGDSDGFYNHILEYVKRGGTDNGIERSLDRMNPLSGLTKDEQQVFASSLTAKELKRVAEALVFYTELRAGSIAAKETPQEDYKIEIIE